MIAARNSVYAADAAHALAGALRAAGIHLPGLHVDPRIWDAPNDGPTRLVTLGAVQPSVARELATVIRLGTGA